MRERSAASAFLAVLAGVALAGCAARPDTASQAANGSPPVAGAAAAGPAASAPDKAGGPIEIVSAQFGVFGADPNGRRYLVETDHFPAIVAAPFGWLVTFKTDKPTVIWREEFELPHEPPTWGPGEAIGAYMISPDRRTAVTERIIPARMGFVGNEWRYAPGDPVGPHKIRVYIDGQLVREFSFAIEPGPGQREGRSRPNDPHHRPSPKTI